MYTFLCMLASASVINKHDSPVFKRLSMHAFMHVCVPTWSKHVCFHACMCPNVMAFSLRIYKYIIYVCMCKDTHVCIFSILWNGRVKMCLWFFVCVCARTRTCAHVYMSVCACVCMYVHVCPCVYERMCMYVYVCAHWISVRMCVCAV